MAKHPTILITLGFASILLILGAADLMLTRGTLRFPMQTTGVAKMSGPDVTAVAQAQGFTVAETTEKNILPTILPADVAETFTARVLLKENDRAATVAWIDSPDVKTFFTTLKKHLRSSFSEKLTDLVDESRTQPGTPPQDILSFRDPAIHDDRLLFVRVRERLYELHVKEGRQEDVDRLMEALTN